MAPVFEDKRNFQPCPKRDRNFDKIHEEKAKTAVGLENMILIVTPGGATPTYDEPVETASEPEMSPPVEQYKDRVRTVVKIGFFIVGRFGWNKAQTKKINPVFNSINQFFKKIKEKLNKKNIFRKVKVYTYFKIV